jgi:hypothetical protein
MLARHSTVALHILNASHCLSAFDRQACLCTLACLIPQTTFTCQGLHHIIIATSNAGLTLGAISYMDVDEGVLDLDFDLELQTAANLAALVDNDENR